MWKMCWKIIHKTSHWIRSVCADQQRELFIRCYGRQKYCNSNTISCAYVLILVIFFFFKCCCKLINLIVDLVNFHFFHQEDIRLAFLNISRIMDCVGCFKCRVWGKIQVCLRLKSVHFILRCSMRTSVTKGSVIVIFFVLLCVSLSARLRD